MSSKWLWVEKIRYDIWIETVGEAFLKVLYFHWNVRMWDSVAIMLSVSGWEKLLIGESKLWSCWFDEVNLESNVFLVCECRWVIPILVLLSDSNTELLSDSSSALCCWVIPALLASWVIPKMKAAVISECFRIIYSALLLWRRPHWICLLYIMLASIEDYLVRWGCIEFGSTNDVEEMIWLWLWISIKFHLVFDCKSTGHWL